MGVVNTVICDDVNNQRRVEVRDGRMLVNDSADSVDFLKNNYPSVAVRLGLVSGLGGNRKFGSNGDIDTGSTPESIWTGGGLYPFATAASNAQVSSDDAQDTSAGTGARTVRLIGLDEDWVQTTETVEMNGLGVVESGTSWIRLDRVVVLTAGSNGTNIGTITVTQGGADTFALVSPGAGQTELALLSIPYATKGAIMSWEVCMRDAGSGTDCTLGLFTRTNEQDYTPGAWRLRSEIGLRGAGTSTFDVQLRNPIIVPQRSDIEVRCLDVTSNNVAITSTFEVLTIADTVTA